MAVPFSDLFFSVHIGIMFSTFNTMEEFEELKLDAESLLMLRQSCAMQWPQTFQKLLFQLRRNIPEVGIQKRVFIYGYWHDKSIFRFIGRRSITCGQFLQIYAFQVYICILFSSNRCPHIDTFQVYVFIYFEAAWWGSRGGDKMTKTPYLRGFQIKSHLLF